MKSSYKLNNKIRVLRAEKNWTQDQLSNKVGATRQTISAIENKEFNPSTKLALLITRAFDADFEDVFFLDGD